MHIYSAFQSIQVVKLRLDQQIARHRHRKLMSPHKAGNTNNVSKKCVLRRFDHGKRASFWAIKPNLLRGSRYAQLRVLVAQQK